VTLGRALGRTVARTVARAMNAAVEQRTLENPSVPLTPTALLEWLGGNPLDAGVRVDEVGALNMPAVWRAVSVLSAIAAALPLHTFVESDGHDHARTSNPLLRNPHPEMTPFELWRLTYVHRMLWGNAYLQKVRNAAGQVVELWPIRPHRVKVAAVRSTPTLPGGKLFEVTDDTGKTHVLSSREVMHLPGMGYDGVVGCSPIRAAAQGISLALAAEKSGAKFFASGAMLGGILQTDQRLDGEQADRLKARWQAKMGGLANAHEVAILDSGAKFQSVTMPYKDAQFLESRRFQIAEIARMTGVPLFLLMETEGSTSWGTGLESQVQGFVTFDLHPGWLVPTEQRITKELLTGEYAEYMVQGLLRGDSTARAEFYRAMREIGAFSANDIRRRENEPPIPEGNTYLQPANMVPLGTDPAPPPTNPAPPPKEDD
jgi:HK97 family phage portal protein